MADGVGRAVTAVEFPPASVVGAPADDASTDIDGVELLPGDEGCRHPQGGVVSLSVSRKYATDGSGGADNPSRYRRRRPDPQESRRRRSAGRRSTSSLAVTHSRMERGSSACNIPTGQRARARPQARPSELPVRWPDAPLRPSRAPLARPQPRDEVGPRPQVPAIERGRVPQLGPGPSKR